MFWHNYKYRIKCIVKDKQTMFWTLLFPIILATLFNLAFSNLSSADDFSIVNIAIVKNDGYEKNKEFIDVINSISEGESDDPVFNIKYQNLMQKIC